MMLLGKITREEWVMRYDKPKTQEAARLALKQYDVFLADKYPNVTEAEIFQTLISAEERERYLFLDRLVQYWKPSKAPATVQLYFGFVRSWLKFNGVKTDDEDLKDFVKLPKRLKEKRQPLTRDVINNILNNCKPFYRALYLVLGCTGMRLNEALHIMVCDIDQSTNPPSIKIRAELTKTSEERVSFLTPEAWSLVRELIKGKKPMDRVFPKSDKTIQSYMRTIRIRCGYTDKYSNGKNYHLNNHRFRSFAYTQMSTSIGEDFAHMVVGHGGYLKQYFGKENQELATEYAKAIPRLTINNEKRLLDENEKLKTRIESVDEMKRRLMEYEDRIKRLEMKRK